MRKQSVAIPLAGVNGAEGAVLTITLLPRDRFQSDPAPLEDKTAEGLQDQEPIQLLESSEYRYEIASSYPYVRVEPSEVFGADDGSGKTGRLQTGLLTGVLSISIYVGDHAVARGRLEIRSRKLDYLSDYQWMLRDLADSFGELLLQPFAASEQRLGLDETRSSESIYQRFAFVRSLLLSEEFRAAIERILHRPHSAAFPVEELRRPDAGIRGGSWLNRSVAKSGPRIPWPNTIPGSTLPVEIAEVRPQETVDTHANRFVKFALSRWRAEVAQILDLLSRRAASLTTWRGTREAREVLSVLDEILSRETFADVSDLDQLHTNDQVLLRREGYRDVARYFFQSQLAASLAWRGGEAVCAAGKRDVAALYEYWVFVQMAKIMTNFSGEARNLRELVFESDDGLNLKLARGEESKVSTTVRRFGRDIEIEVWFNRTFSSPRDSSSWTVAMRPDFSVRIRSLSDPLGRRTGEVWLHFDAKYSGEEVISDMEAGIGADAVPSENAKDFLASRTDLLKMHAYRDAIRRSAGAYVLYPGQRDAALTREYHELLPGLGAFCLRPTAIGDPAGLRPIHEFFDNVISHVASQMTQHERGRFWRNESYSPDAVSFPEPAAAFLERPPADTLVLVGYVKDSRHWEWIVSKALYNLRASGRQGSVALNGRELGSDLVLLYNADMNLVQLRRIVGAPLVMNDMRMAEAGYPDPEGEYVCLPLGECLNDGGVTAISARHLDSTLTRSALRRVVGAPVVMSWQELTRMVRANPAPEGLL